MDGQRFDTLSRRIAGRVTRRATVGGLVASAIGAPFEPALARAAKDQVCTLAFETTALIGPSQEQGISAGSPQPGQLQGQLRFSLSESGNLEHAALVLPDGASFKVVGQATGHALQFRIALDERRAVVATGVGEREITECSGAIDGMTMGPLTGDLGEWHAQGQARAGRAAAADGQSGEASAAAQATQPTPVPAPNAAPQALPLDCGVDSAACNGVCVDVLFDPGNCGQCGMRCTREEACVAGTCQPSAALTVPPGQATECFADMALCNGVCIDVMGDRANCGSCGFQCTGRNICIAGTCHPPEDLAFTPGQTLDCGVDSAACDGVCVDVLFDPFNCGGCGVRCSLDSACMAGTCQPVNAAPLDCASQGLLDCGGVCIDAVTDPANCGFCGNACSIESACHGGSCI